MHLARDSLEVMSLSLAISPQVLASLETSQDWKHFVIDSLLLIRNRFDMHIRTLYIVCNTVCVCVCMCVCVHYICQYAYDVTFQPLLLNRLIRITAADQLFYIVTKCSVSTSSFIKFISLLFSAVEVSYRVMLVMLETYRRVAPVAGMPFTIEFGNV